MAVPAAGLRAMAADLSAFERSFQLPLEIEMVPVLLIRARPVRAAEAHWCGPVSVGREKTR